MVMHAMNVVVIDNGGGVLKVGLAGSLNPVR
jgi:hypothetical protein